VRPLQPPLVKRGQPGQFIPFEVTNRDPVIRDLPATPIDLLFRYIPQEMAESWAQWTNEAPRSREGPRQRHSRENQWRPTSTEEIYLFLDILIYMGIHHETNTKRYWSNSFDQEDPIYLFTCRMPRDRFLLLFRRLRVFSPAGLDRPAALSGGYGRGHRRTQPQEGLMPSVYRQVDRWSKHIQETGDSMYVPGSDLTVDEAMVRFTGRSLETTTIPQKPTPTGYKVWVLGQSGYFVRWLWHVHGRGPCGLVPQQCSRQGDEEVVEEHLTPTQRVVTTLLTLLPLAVYHVFLDNLFVSVKLFKALRSSQVGAAGTCRRIAALTSYSLLRRIGKERESLGAKCTAFRQRMERYVVAVGFIGMRSLQIFYYHNVGKSV
jgi:hypothetical protein